MNNNDKDTNDEAKEHEHVIVIQFAGKDNCNLSIMPTNTISPAQMILAGKYLTMIGEGRQHTLWQARAVEEMNKQRQLASVQNMLLHTEEKIQ